MKSFIALALALTWSTTDCDAIKIDASSVAPPTTLLDKYQTLEKTWNVSGESGLRNLLVQAPGIVFVDYDASLSDDLIAKVVVSGDSEDLISAFDLVSWSEHDSDGVALHFKLGKDGSYRGHLFTQILVGDKQALKNLKSAGSADVVIRDDVLVNNDASATLELGVLGSGDMTVKSTQKLSVGTLSVLTAGSGDVEVNSPSIVASKSVSVNVHGSGDVALVANEITTDLLNLMSIGSGDIFIQSDNVNAKDINTVAMGSGDVNFSRGGKCVKHTIKLTASGSVAAGSIVSKSTDVEVFGSGDVLVQATEKLAATISASGTVNFVSVTPQEVVVTDHSSHHRDHHDSYKKQVKYARHNKYGTYVVRSEHHRYPEYVSIRDGKHSVVIDSDDSDDWPSSWEYHDSDDDSVYVSDGGDVWVGNFAASLPSAAQLSSPVVIVGLLGVVIGVVGVAVRKYRQQRANNRTPEFSRLILADTHSRELA